MSLLREERLAYRTSVPPILRDLRAIQWESVSQEAPSVRDQFPLSGSSPLLQGFLDSSSLKDLAHPLRVGVVFSGGPAPGGHNVVIGLFEGLVQLHPQSVLYGFLNGPAGVVQGHYRELTSSVLSSYRNSGGFDLLGSGRTKIETPEQLKSVQEVVQRLQLDGLVIIGGDDSNTNAAVLAEYFLAHQVKTCVVGVPKTIDGDLKQGQIEQSFGFDTASKTYSQIIGNIAQDALSARKYYHFIRLMGRSASHITLECALLNRPNLAWISEEVKAQRRTLADLVAELVDLVCERAEQGKLFGVLLIPEGIIEAIEEMNELIGQINQILLTGRDVVSIVEKLTEGARALFVQLPPDIQSQLLQDRDPHGNVQVSAIETDKLFLHLVQESLKKRKSSIAFHAVSHFLGYEGRSGFPSCFDCDYCYCLGLVAARLLGSGKTGYMAAVTGLSQDSDAWQIAGIPLVSLMHLEWRKGKQKPVIAKAFVRLDDPAFHCFQQERSCNRLEDRYQNPGPIQFSGSRALTHAATVSLLLNTAFSKTD